MSESATEQNYQEAYSRKVHSVHYSTQGSGNHDAPDLHSVIQSESEPGLIITSNGRREDILKNWYLNNNVSRTNDTRIP